MRASRAGGSDDFELHEELRLLLEHALERGLATGQVSQLADGDPPRRPRGSPAQAWAVGELLGSLVKLDV